jgi:Flp pilus assembly protein TadD
MRFAEVLICAVCVTAVAQQVEPGTTQQAINATLNDLRGIDELFDAPAPRNPEDRATLWSLYTQNSAMAPRYAPSSAGTAGLASVSQIRHTVSRDVKKAYDKGSKAFRANDFVTAAAQFEKVIELDPAFGEAYGDLGIQYARLDRYQDAERVMLQAIILMPNDWLPHANLGWIQLRLGQTEEAEASLRRAIRISPNNAQLSLLLGSVLLRSAATEQEGISYLKYAARTLPEATRQLKRVGR